MSLEAKNKIKINMDAISPRKEWYRHTIKDGSNVFRILPPFGEKANGYPYAKWSLIWGLNDPESLRKRPYPSSLLREKRCPVVEFVDALKREAELLKTEMISMQESDEVIKERLSPINRLIMELVPKNVFIYNAVDKSGQVGLLTLKSSAHKKLKQAMLEYVRDYNQDPTSLNSEPDDSGVWFEIIKTGSKWDTTYDVKRVTHKRKDSSGRLIFEDDRSPLPANVVEQFESLAYDLQSIYQHRTYDELLYILLANRAQIVAQCPEADNVFLKLFGDKIAAQDLQNNTTPSSTEEQQLVKLNSNTRSSVVSKMQAILEDSSDEDDSSLEEESDADVFAKNLAYTVTNKVSTKQTQTSTQSSADSNKTKSSDQLLSSLMTKMSSNR